MSIKGYKMEILAKRLRELRDEKKLSRKAVAKNLKVVERTYQRYEEDECEPTAPVLVQLADLYEVSVDYLLGRTNQK